jgi:hypothetical protein
VRLVSDTRVRLKRAAWPVVLDATPLTVLALRPGDFVTVTRRRDGASGIAAVIDVIPPTRAR